jgi:DNA-binding NtrC family response regulator
MTQAESLKEVLVIDDDVSFRFLIRELLGEVIHVVDESTNFDQAMAAIKRVPNNTGVICDLKLTFNGEEGLIILEEAVRLGLRDLILFTTIPGAVSQEWQKRFPNVDIVEKGNNGLLIAAVNKWSGV